AGCCYFTHRAVFSIRHVNAVRAGSDAVRLPEARTAVGAVGAAVVACTTGQRTDHAAGGYATDELIQTIRDINISTAIHRDALGLVKERAGSNAICAYRS